MNTSAFVFLIGLATIIGLGLIIWLCFYLYKSCEKSLEDSQAIISDKDLLLLINDQLDQMISRSALMQKSSLSKTQAKN